MPLSYFKNCKIEEWEQMIDVNIKGVLYCTSAVIPHMLDKKSGHIVNISSVAGRIVFAGGSVYCATKHAITALSEGLRKELSPEYNIRVTCIEPGAVSTELLESITDESMSKFVQASKDMERLQSEDIANAILYTIQAPNHVNVNEILMRPHGTGKIIMTRICAYTTYRPHRMNRTVFVYSATLALLERMFFLNLLLYRCWGHDLV